ncbi:hypothetical protein OGAPHI_003229 [Ogataea philodendri]|uniref:Uncharacterized protein n=1 Tax=Ogataea philodendri TaxID=1378263 RepID=A0A9P8P7R6_9ASCO|nr:uncharacterized protein OGAPHI_003229 [Ogataea philodendri]KAH3666780.1 hypothetical protein OGAPHI_003229 [Ogataea philodendri]
MDSYVASSSEFAYGWFSLVDERCHHMATQLDIDHLGFALLNNVIWNQRKESANGLIRLIVHDHGVSPVSELVLVQVEPVLLRAHHHSWSDHSHVTNTLVSGEAVSVDQVCSDQTACSSQTGLTMNGNLAASLDHCLCCTDEFLNIFHCWTCSIVENHIDMLDASFFKLVLVIKVRVESHHELDVALDEIVQNFLKRLVQRSPRREAPVELLAATPGGVTNFEQEPCNNITNMLRWFSPLRQTMSRTQQPCSYWNCRSRYCAKSLQICIGGQYGVVQSPGGKRYREESPQR